MTVTVYFSFCRSKDFRPAYGQLHEVRALIPQGVPYLACTATITRSVREEVERNLDMSNCDFVCTSPDRPNIRYEVCCRSDIETDMHSLVVSLKECNKKSPRVIIYCRTLNMCADLYAHFHFELGDSSYYPPEAAHISDNRLFGMFHSNTTQYNKDIILKSLSIPDGVVRIVFATVALGMGVNLVDCNHVIHYGAPQSIEDYFQESGRVGRSGDRAKSSIFWKPGDCPLKVEPITARDKEMLEVRMYLENKTECRRKWLLDYFDQACAKRSENPSTCCDICEHVALH